MVYYLMCFGLTGGKKRDSKFKLMTGFMKHSPQSLVLLKKNTIKISLEPHQKKKKIPLSGNKLLLIVQ